MSSVLHSRVLHDGWTVTALDGPMPDGTIVEGLPAVVPGVVHTDLLRAGVIEDPFDGANEATVQWIGRTTWQYDTTFEWLPDDLPRHDLVAACLDTVAAVSLNGVSVGSSENQHRSHRFDLRPALRPGINRLRVVFAAPVPEAERREAEHGRLPHTNHHPYNTLRKSACNFGWDWGIDVATSGIAKPIALESWAGARIAAARYLVAVDGPAAVPTGRLTVVLDIERAASDDVGEVAVSVEVAGRTAHAAVAAAASSVRLELDVPNVRLWWPRGYGDQPLYDVVVRIDDDPTSERRSRIGFRSVTLNTTPDEPTPQHRRAGAPFELSVNGRLIRVRGANWIPDHAFPSEIDSARYARRIADATEANVNLLRVWGGGSYEDDEFYRYCDEQGVLVWQDFPFACAAYAEEQWLAAEVELEAREQIARLSRHSSLVVWNGNNENIWLRIDDGWRHELGDRTWGNGYYRDLLPRLLNELDPTRPYSPASPYSFDDYLHPNDPDNGTMHAWDVWNRIDYVHYRDHAARFVAEFGFQGPPAWSTLRRVVHDEPLDPFGAQMLVHQKARGGNDKLSTGMAGHLPAPRGIADWHWATQLNQAHAVRFGIEHFRSLAPLNAGMIVWQLNDNWPVISWSAVDFDEHRKPLWYALRDAYRARLLTVQPRDGAWSVVLVNDTDETWPGEVSMARQSFDGRALAADSVPAGVAARGVATVPVPSALGRPDDARAEVLVVAADGFDRTILNFAEVVDQRLVPAPFTARVTPHDDAALVRVTARSYTRDLFAQVDRVAADARVDDGMVSLLAGESAELRVTACGDVEALLHPLVLRCANDLLSH